MLECIEEVFQRWERKKISRGYKRKLRREAFRQSHNIRKGGKVIERHMSKEDRRLHEKVQKDIFDHTRSLSIVVNKMKDVGIMGNNEKANVGMKNSYKWEDAE